MEAPKLTPEQEHRRDLLFLLHCITARATDVIWLHFTDISDQIELFDELLEKKLIVRHPMYKYIPDGSWQDHFPPTAYFVSFAGLAILNNASLWVFEGEIGGHI